MMIFALCVMVGKRLCPVWRSLRVCPVRSGGTACFSVILTLSLVLVSSVHILFSVFVAKPAVILSMSCVLCSDESLRKFQAEKKASPTPAPTVPVPAVPAGPPPKEVCVCVCECWVCGRDVCGRNCCCCVWLLYFTCCFLLLSRAPLFSLLCRNLVRFLVVELSVLLPTLVGLVI